MIKYLSSLFDKPKLNSMKDVYEEFNEFAKKSGIKEFHCSTVTKHYAFEQEDTPLVSEYLEVRYPAWYPAMPSNYSGSSIKRVFGTTVNALEVFIIERNIKGPCWLDVKHPLPSRLEICWIKIKVTCAKMENICLFRASSFTTINNHDFKCTNIIEFGISRE
ncbi:DNA polymerase alpha catalytic subunit-like [Megalopta genalis]|uniref:DNA polymerase alpha catalytic subunit-like n=1 Tax=Megalopta genalis TaxID=115081 RepID=UPI003FD512BE